FSALAVTAISSSEIYTPSLHDALPICFGYRKSLISEKKLIIVEGCIELEEGKKDEILARMEDLNKSRREKQPLNFPSAGSTFKRDRKSTRLNSSHVSTSYAVFCLKKKT